MNRIALTASMVTVLFISIVGAQGGDPSYKAKRINKMIELLEVGVEKLDAARARIMAAMKANHIFPLHSSSIDNLERLINAGIMVTHGTSVEITNKGRAYTKRQMPYSAA